MLESGRGYIFTLYTGLEDGVEIVHVGPKIKNNIRDGFTDISTTDTVSCSIILLAENTNSMLNRMAIGLHVLESLREDAPYKQTAKSVRENHQTRNSSMPPKQALHVTIRDTGGALNAQRSASLPRNYKQEE